MFYCLVVGSRNFNDYELMSVKLKKMLHNYIDITIVSGGANGADKLSERFAIENGYDMKIFYADWDKYGKGAGYIRNEEMHKYISQFQDRGCVAFWDGISKGTQHNFKLAEKYNTRIRTIKY